MGCDKEDEYIEIAKLRLQSYYSGGHFTQQVGSAQSLKVNLRK